MLYRMLQRILTLIFLRRIHHLTWGKNKMPKAGYTGITLKTEIAQLLRQKAKQSGLNINQYLLRLLSRKEDQVGLLSLWPVGPRGFKSRTPRQKLACFQEFSFGCGASQDRPWPATLLTSVISRLILSAEVSYDHLLIIVVGLSSYLIKRGIQGLTSVFSKTSFLCYCYGSC